RREDVEDIDGAGREEALLPDQLDQVRDRLQEPEGPGAVRPVAELHPAEHLALHPRHVGEREQQQVDDHEGLDERDPPGVGHLLTSTWPPRSPACSAAIRTTPCRSWRPMRARSSSEVPLWE